MQFATPLIPATLIRRYKRFLADVRLETGDEVTVHCPNPGSMMRLADPDTRIWLEPNDDPRKKLRFGWRMNEYADGVFVGIDTSLANRIVKSALLEQRIKGLPAYDDVRAEVPYGDASRVDFLLQGNGGHTYLEVKSVTLSREKGLAEFPDSVTKRGAKHLGELAQVVANGQNAVLLYLVQRNDCKDVAVARDIDPVYAAAFDDALAAGVQMIGISCDVTPEGIVLAEQVTILPR